LADTAYFTLNFPYANHPGLDSSILSNSTPWIHYGGSYAGAKSAFVKLLYPDQIWGSIASSGVVWAVEDFWQYMEPIRLHAESQCISVIEGVVALLDRAIKRAGTDKHGDERKSGEVVHLMKLFGLDGLASVKDFVNAVSYPLGDWQENNWDSTLPGTSDWEWFCSNLTASSANATNAKRFSAPGSSIELRNGGGSTLPEDYSKHTWKGLTNYAKYIKTYVVDGCVSNETTIEDCFGTDNATWYYDTSLSQVSCLINLPPHR
jgi:Serine carboxypeptidase S28